MKHIIALLLICLTISEPMVKKETYPFDAVRTFFDAIGLDQIDDLIVKGNIDITHVIDLIGQILKDFAKSPRSWIDLSDAISKFGRIFDVIASDIRDNINNTKLHQQIDMMLDYLNDILRNPVTFINKVNKNIQDNSMQLMFKIYDLKNVLQTGDFPEFGRRLADMAKIVFKDAVTPSRLRLLYGRRRGRVNLRRRFQKIKIKSIECFSKIYALASELFKVITKETTIDTAEVMKLLYEMSEVLAQCIA